MTPSDPNFKRREGTAEKVRNAREMDGGEVRGGEVSQLVILHSLSWPPMYGTICHF